MLLVLSATLVDLNVINCECDAKRHGEFEQTPYENTKISNEWPEENSQSSTGSQNQVCPVEDCKTTRNNEQQTQQQQQSNHQICLRDQRSPSLSSSCSSSLFCSANSISAPILNNYKTTTSVKAAVDRKKKKSLSQSRRRQMKSSRLDSNTGGAGNWYSKFRARSNEKSNSREAAKGNGFSNYEQNLQFGSATKNDKSIGELYAVCEDKKSSLEDETINSSEHSLNSDEGDLKNEPFRQHLLMQIFLAFSLRHSAALIFKGYDNDSDNNRRNVGRSNYRAHNQLAADNKLKFGSDATRCANSKLTRQCAGSNELSERRTNDQALPREHSINCCSTQQLMANCQQQQSTDQANHRPQSIDSLHGLRFLSMVWIIVIHSYNFALRWSFFDTNNPNLINDDLNDLYKTSASQLLANGSFACDSFFFTGGFLLPYLTFPSLSNGNGRIGSSSTLSKTASTCQKESSPTAGSRVEQVKDEEEEGQEGDSGLASSKNNSIKEGNEEANGDDIVVVIIGNENSNQQQQQLAPVASSSEGEHKSSRLSLEVSEYLMNLAPQMVINCKQNQPNSKPQKQPTTDEGTEFSFKSVLANLLHRYIRMMPLMMAIIGLSATLLRYLGEGSQWDNSTMMFDKWCRNNWWINLLFLHNFVKRETMCLSHSWYSAVDIQLFLVGQILILLLYKSKRLGLAILILLLVFTQLITGLLTLVYHLPAVPLISNVSESVTNLYYGEIYIKPYCRASPYLIGILLAYLMRTTSLGQLRLSKFQTTIGWSVAIGCIFSILMAMKPAMNGQAPSELESALYSSLSRPLWACATGWMIFACITQNGGIFKYILEAKLFVPLSRLTYPAFLIHPIVMAIFYGSRGESNQFQFSHYLMLYLILGNIVITYASAFILSALFELPLLSIERVVKRAWSAKSNTKKA